MMQPTILSCSSTVKWLSNNGHSSSSFRNTCWSNVPLIDLHIRWSFAASSWCFSCQSTGSDILGFVSLKFSCRCESSDRTRDISLKSCSSYLWSMNGSHCEETLWTLKLGRQFHLLRCCELDRVPKYRIPIINACNQVILIWPYRTLRFSLHDLFSILLSDEIGSLFEVFRKYHHTSML